MNGCAYQKVRPVVLVNAFYSTSVTLETVGVRRLQVEVSHEALIRTWPRLRDWIDANREKLRARAAVLQAKAEWEHQERRDDLLLPAGFQLERARWTRSIFPSTTRPATSGAYAPRCLTSLRSVTPAGRGRSAAFPQSATSESARMR